MRMFLRYFSVIALVIAFVMPAFADDEAYAIKLNRPAKAGEVFHEHTKLDVERTITNTPPAGAPDKRVQQIAADLEYRLTTKAADEFGDATELSLEVVKFDFGKDGREALPKGTMISIRRTEKGVTFTLPVAKTMESEQQWVLQFIFGPLQPAINQKKLSIDDVWGLKTPRKVGEEWEADPEKLARAISTAHTQFDPRSTTSRIKLVAMETTPSGEKALRIKGTTIMATPKRSDLMPSFVDQKSQSRQEWNRLIPLDHTHPVAEEANLYDLDWKGTDPQSRATLQVQVHLNAFTKIEPVPREPG
jgi:hypothetical protein